MRGGSDLDTRRVAMSMTVWFEKVRYFRTLSRGLVVEVQAALAAGCPRLNSTLPSLAPAGAARGGAGRRGAGRASWNCNTKLAVGSLWAPLEAASVFFHIHFLFIFAIPSVGSLYQPSD